MKFIVIISAILLYGLLEVSDGYRILAVFPYSGRSHFKVFEVYLEELANRGHEVVVMSPFPREQAIPNYKDINLKENVAANTSVIGLTLADIGRGSQIESILKLSEWGVKACRKTFQHPLVQKLLNSNEKFDVMLAEPFNTDCYLAFGYKFQVPIIGFSSCSFMPWVPARIGNPDNPAFIPTHFGAFSDKMTFMQRLSNTVSYVAHYLHYPFTMDAPGYEVAKEFFGNELPLLSELARNTSLILTNSHFSLNRPLPLVPGTVEVAGIHLRPAKKLPKDLDDFLNGAEHGVIYFSMGSVIRAETLPEDKRDAFLQAFAELPQRVLWKWENDSLPGQPHNVKIAKWLPQFDVLSHPQVRVFLAHGGLLGTIEAVHLGVPMVGIPMFGDQNVNIKMVEEAGMGVVLHYSDITKDNVLKTLRAVLDNPSYMENAKRTSRIFRDRPMSPMDTAIYWTEYVIRHHGAPHLRSAGADLPLYQYLLLDVIAILLAGVLAVVFVIYFLLRKLVALVCGGAKTTSKSKKQQ